MVLCEINQYTSNSITIVKGLGDYMATFRKIGFYLLTMAIYGCSSNSNFEIHGHRGTRGLAPENTIVSFQKAMDYGAYKLELDVVISADSQVIVSHDTFFNPDFTTKPDGTPLDTSEVKNYNLFEMSTQEIQQFDVGKRIHPKFPNQIPQASYKPTLAEVVKACEEHARKNNLEMPRFNIELKSSSAWVNKSVPEPKRFVQLVVDEIRALGIQDRCNMQSFDFEILKETKKQAPEIMLAVLLSQKKTLEQVEEDLGFKPDVWAPYFTALNDSIVTHMHANQVRVIPWTVNDTTDMNHLIAMKVDGIITDYPNRLQDLLRTK